MHETSQGDVLLVRRQYHWIVREPAYDASSTLRPRRRGAAHVPILLYVDGAEQWPSSTRAGLPAALPILLLLRHTCLSRAFQLCQRILQELVAELGAHILLRPACPVLPEGLSQGSSGRMLCHVLGKIFLPRRGAELSGRGTLQAALLSLRGR